MKTWLALALVTQSCLAAEPDLILHNGKIVTVDQAFSVQEAIAIREGRIERVGPSKDILALKGSGTKVEDLQGRTVLPGLIDSHAHPLAASLYEVDHVIPPMDEVKDVLNYISTRAKVTAKGDWIPVHQVFITRLKERRYPTRAELDSVAPEHPVIFATGPDCMLNTLGLKLNKIDRDYQQPDGPGLIERDPATREPTGLIRTYRRLLHALPSRESPSVNTQIQALEKLAIDYLGSGITAVCERDTSPGALEVYRASRNLLKIRVLLTCYVNSEGDLNDIKAAIAKVSRDPLWTEKDPHMRIIGIKTYLDGGMLTGSAYLGQPWGKSQIYGITDPTYRGVLFIQKQRLHDMVQAAFEHGFQFTAHSVGDGAVAALLDVYDDIKKEQPASQGSACVSHANFLSGEIIRQAARLGVALDIQPAWLYMDASTLSKHFGYDRLRYFQPLRSLMEAGVLIGGGSDHMQKIGSMRSNNPYNPFLGLATALMRKARDQELVLHPEEALTREQALRFYTINNARLLGMDKHIGSLERGKEADFIVVDRDYLSCPVQEISSTRVLRTYVDGQLIDPKP